jgi:chromosomal replication initiator protein
VRKAAVIVDPAKSVSKIPLERPASVRRHLPMASDKGWMLPDYVVGPENDALLYLFDDNNIRQLANLSPVVLYGELNTGKTALSVTLAVRWSRLSGLRPLSFATAPNYASDYSSSVEIDDLSSFRKRHRECQLLLIDDVELLARSNASQLELVHNLDALAESSRPVILTVNRLPSGVRGLCSALTSRLAGGLSISLLPPGIETRQEIVRSLIANLDPKLPTDELVSFCARFSPERLTAPDLLKIVSLAAQHRTATGSLDLNVLALLAAQLFHENVPTVSSIAKVVARKMHVRLAEMRGATREANIVRARGLAIVLARKLTSASLHQIGEFFGNRDHSTIIHACRKTEKLIESDTELANLLLEAQSELLG